MRLVLMLCSLWLVCAAHAGGLDETRLGVIYNLDDSNSRAIAQYYVAQRKIPPQNLIGVHLPATRTLSPQAFAPVREYVLDHLPSAVQSLALIWSEPFAVGCMSITSAFAAGYRPELCEPGCERTAPSPLFNAEGWLPADTVGWWPSMLLPTADVALARALIARGKAASGGNGGGTLYLVRTQDSARNVRAAGYPQVEALLARRLRVVEKTTPVTAEVEDAIGYFTGVAKVEELARIHFRPGAIADHLTSVGGLLTGGNQMPALAWLKQGATGSYGTVSEPCSHLGKFPDIGVLMMRYARGETLLESYWKSVAMPGQGLFIGEPLSRAFASPTQASVP